MCTRDDLFLPKLVLLIGCVGGISVAFHSIRSGQVILRRSWRLAPFLRVHDRVCPNWLHDYELFHEARRGQTGTKYLVQLCDGSVPTGGLGDRLNGALFSLRLAYSLNRVLLIAWTQPYGIENFLVPASAQLNWSAAGINITHGRVHNFMDRRGWAASALTDGSLQHVEDTFLAVFTNAPVNWTCHGCPVLASEWSHEAACLWGRMFQPVPAIVQQAQSELTKLLPTNVPYTAVHLRLGGLTGEPGIPGEDRGRGVFSNFIAAIRCATNVARNHSVDTTNIVVVTDNHHLRQFIHGHYLRQLVSPSGLPVHFEKASAESMPAHMSVFVDMLLLGHAECLVTSRSGFSLHAWLSGGAKPCRVQFTDCL